LQNLLKRGTKTIFISHRDRVQQPEHLEEPAGKAARKPAPASDIIWLFVATRLLLIMVTYIGFILFAVPAHFYPNTPVDVIGLFTSWNHWDAANFTYIAQFGYTRVELTAFFPLFPLLIKVIAFLIGNTGYIAIGMILSNLALLGTMFILYQIAVDALGDQVGRRVLLYLCLFPTAFFFFAAYNESLFLFLTTSSFLAIHRHKWWLAAILGFFAALTRSAGLFLVIPFLYEAWISRESSGTSARIILHKLPGFLLQALPVILIPLGTVLYCIYTWILFGNPFAFAAVQIYWARHLSWPWVGIWQALVDIFWATPFGSFYEVHTLIDLTATIGFIILAILGWRKLRTSYNLWLVILLLFMLLSPATTQHDALQSNQRFVLEMFPAFITLAALGIKHHRFHQALMLLFPTLQAVLAMLFVLNRWMV
jgi:Gpi18-like mannosyltransferase